MARNGFRSHAGGVYTCRCCDRRTRHTGSQALGSDMCAECYEIAGIDNQINDDGREGPNEYEQRELDTLIFHIEKRGGNVEKVKSWNDFCFSTPIATPIANVSSLSTIFAEI